MTKQTVNNGPHNLTGGGGCGGGIGSRCLTENQPAMRQTPEPSKFRDERPTFWLNPHEVDRRGTARATGVANGGRRQTGNGGNSDVGGR